MKKLKICISHNKQFAVYVTKFNFTHRQRVQAKRSSLQKHILQCIKCKATPVKMQVMRPVQLHVHYMSPFEANRGFVENSDYTLLYHGDFSNLKDDGDASSSDDGNSDATSNSDDEQRRIKRFKARCGGEDPCCLCHPSMTLQCHTRDAFGVYKWTSRSDEIEWNLLQCFETRAEAEKCVRLSAHGWWHEDGTKNDEYMTQLVEDFDEVTMTIVFVVVNLTHGVFEDFPVYMPLVAAKWQEEG